MAAYHFGGICVSRWVVEEESFLRAKSSVVPCRAKFDSVCPTGSTERCQDYLMQLLCNRHAVYVQKMNLKAMIDFHIKRSSACRIMIHFLFVSLIKLFL